MVKRNRLRALLTDADTGLGVSRRSASTVMGCGCGAEERERRTPTGITKICAGVEDTTHTFSSTKSEYGNTSAFSGLSCGPEGGDIYIMY